MEDERATGRTPIDKQMKRATHAARARRAATLPLVIFVGIIALRIFLRETPRSALGDDQRLNLLESQHPQTHARVPCVPPYCAFRCAQPSAVSSSSPHTCGGATDDIEREEPGRITCRIGGVDQIFHNIVFGIPEQEIVDCVPAKAFDFAHIIPGQSETYIFGKDEPEYKRNYRESHYAFTFRKWGWDCLRHYEILAAGAIPFFTDLEGAPRTLMSLLPKALILEGMRLPGVKDKHIDHAVFDPDAYSHVACRTLEYTRRYLSTKAIARYVLETMGKPEARRVLLLSSKTEPDYMRDLLVHGMRELLGTGAVDVPVWDWLYEYPSGIPPMQVQDQSLYGGGFSYAHRLPRIEVDRDNLAERIAAREFDVVIYACTQGELPHLKDVLRHYDSSSIAVVNGEDWYGWTKIEQPGYPQHTLLGKAVHFVRELPDSCPEGGTEAK